MIYTVTCNPSLDYTMWLPTVQPNRVLRSTREQLSYGGKGINVSAIAARLGADTCALGFVAGFTGEHLQTLLDEDGIANDFVQLSNGRTRINIKLFGQEEWDVNATGPTVDEQAADKLLQKIETLSTGDVLALGGTVPKGLPNDFYLQLLKRVQGHGVLTVVDAEGDLLRRSLEFRPFLIKPNHHELGALFDRTDCDADELIDCARRLQQEGARNVLVSRASKGALLVDETGEVHHIGTVSGEVRNAVGCGDSMVAGFLVGWLQRGEYAYALRLGAACGNATAFSDKLATREEIDRVLACFEA